MEADTIKSTSLQVFWWNFYTHCTSINTLVLQLLLHFSNGFLGHCVLKMVCCMNLYEQNFNTAVYSYIDYFNTECFDRNLLISTGFVRLQKYMYMVRNMKDSRGWKFNTHYLVGLIRTGFVWYKKPTRRYHQLTLPVNLTYQILWCLCPINPYSLIERSRKLSSGVHF